MLSALPGSLDAKDERKIGGLWEEMKGGKCLFVMATEKDWKPITQKMASHGRTP